jgi:SulP family sulfate permease
MAVGSKIAFINNYDIEGDQEIFAMGASNFFASFALGYPACGSFSRTAEMHTIGARTQMASFIVGFVIMFALLFLSPLFFYLPNTTLAAVVITAVIALVDIEEPKRLFKYHWRDLLNLLVAFIVTFGWGLEWGVVAALASSFVTVTLVTIRPSVVKLGRVDGDHFAPLTEQQSKYEVAVEKFFWKNRDALTEEPIPPAGGIIFRVEAPLYFLNVAHVFSKLATLEKIHKEKGEKLEWVIFDMKNITDVDATAIEALVTQNQHHKLNNVWFALVDMNLHVKKQMKDAEVFPQHISEKICFRSIADALRKRMELNKAPLSDEDRDEDVASEDADEKFLVLNRRESLSGGSNSQPTHDQGIEMNVLKVTEEQPLSLEIQNPSASEPNPRSADQNLST